MNPGEDPVEGLKRLLTEVFIPSKKGGWGGRVDEAFDFGGERSFPVSEV